MIPERIKMLREANNLSQNQLAKKLGISRSAVNAWEMGISIPATQYLVELAHLFKVSTDYLLGLNISALDISGLDEKEVAIVYSLASHFKEKRNSDNKELE